MILRRYMIREVATTTALVLGFLVVMLLGGRLIRYFGMAAEGGLDVGVLFTLIGYNLPYFLELIFPLSFFIGLMLVFGRLYADHEMAVLNASGISRGRVSRLLIPLVLVAFLAQGFITLVAKPWGVAKAANIWQEQSVLEIFDIITQENSSVVANTIFMSARLARIASTCRMSLSSKWRKTLTLEMPPA